MNTQTPEQQQPEHISSELVTRDAPDAATAKLEAAIAQLELRLAKRLDQKLDANRRHTAGVVIAAAAVVAPVGTLAS